MASLRAGRRRRSARSRTRSSGTASPPASVSAVDATTQKVSCYRPELAYFDGLSPVEGYPAGGGTLCGSSVTTGESQGPYDTQDGAGAANEPMVVKDHSESDIRVDPTNPSHLIGQSKWIVNAEGYNHLLGFYESFDGGLTWSTQGHVPGYEGWTDNTDPVGAFDPYGNFYSLILPYNFYYSKSGEGGARTGIALMLDETTRSKLAHDLHTPSVISGYAQLLRTRGISSSPPATNVPASRGRGGSRVLERRRVRERPPRSARGRRRGDLLDTVGLAVVATPGHAPWLPAWPTPARESAARPSLVMRVTSAQARAKWRCRLTPRIRCCRAPSARHGDGSLRAGCAASDPARRGRRDGAKLGRARSPSTRGLSAAPEPFSFPDRVTGQRDDAEGRLARLQRTGALHAARRKPPAALVLEEPPSPEPEASALEALLDKRSAAC